MAHRRKSCPTPQIEATNAPALGKKREGERRQAVGHEVPRLRFQRADLDAALFGNPWLKGCRFNLANHPRDIASSAKLAVRSSPAFYMRTADDLFGTPPGSPRTEGLVDASIQWGRALMRRLTSDFRDYFSASSVRVSRKNRLTQPASCG